MSEQTLHERMHGIQRFLSDFCRRFPSRVTRTDLLERARHSDGEYLCAYNCGNKVIAPLCICLTCLIEESVANAPVEAQREADLAEVQGYSRHTDDCAVWPAGYPTAAVDIKNVCSCGYAGVRTLRLVK